jgi:hypothetical protein
MFKLSIFCFLFFCFQVTLIADSQIEASNSDCKNPALCDSVRKGVSDHSDAQFDRRLPPVLPGERISDGEKTVKVWTTVGPVPVVPNANVDINRNYNNNYNNVNPNNPPSVIIDHRQKH